MPEGDTVHKIAAYLRERILGIPLSAGRLRDQPGLDLAGLRIERITTHGKHLFLEFDDGTMVRSHLGMDGSWHRYPEGQPWRLPADRASIELHAGGNAYVCFNAEEVERMRRGGVRARQIETRLGPDLLVPEVDLDLVLARARAWLPPDALVADVLLDQRIASGIGNVYKSEVLFLERVYPGRVLSELDGALLRSLFETARSLLRANTGGGPRLTRDAGPSDPEPQTRLWIYGRLGRPCLRCGAPIRHRRMGRTWRSTYWCPRCQDEGAPI